WDDPDVLTVAQDGSAKFKTIGAALDAVKPGQTIRVLDDKDYVESLNLNRPVNYQGITLEAVRQARLGAGVARRPGGNIEGVANVRIRGFRLRADADKVGLIRVFGRCAGLLLDHLEMEAGRPTYSGVEFHGANLVADDPPAVVQNCVFRKPQLG